MDIVIPTYGRCSPGLQTTLLQLNKAGVRPYVVIQAREADTWARHNWEAEVRILPHHIQTIAPTRQWIVENVGATNKLVMMDDDLIFYRRRNDDPTKLRDLAVGELQHMLHQVSIALDLYSHVGIAAREGANRCTDATMSNTRIMRVLGYQRDLLLRECITFGRLQVMEDFDVALRLLRAGHENIVLNQWAHNQAGSGKEGGCSHFRTKELQAESAHKLAELHPSFVQVREKETKTAWGGGTRTDVQIYWKKAYSAGRNLK